MFTANQARELAHILRDARPDGATSNLSYDADFKDPMYDWRELVTQASVCISYNPVLDPEAFEQICHE